MGFFKSLKGKADVGTNSDYQPSNTQYLSGNHDELSTANDKRRLFGFSSSSSRSQSSQQQQQQQPQQSSQPTYLPPPNPSSKHDYQAPPGPPPPRTNAEPPPYHDWTSVPDNSQLPPPPSFFSELSPTNNATPESADAAHDWCDAYPPYAPSAPSPTLITAAATGNLTLEQPPNWARTSTLTHLRPGTYSIRTKASATDTILLSSLPIYFAAASHPLHTESPKTIYYEVHIQRILNAQSAIAVGFAGKPYPPWRLPGWHRASIGVHSDDGRRYINDSWGGIEFVSPFKEGEVVGVGMRFGTTALEGSEVTVKTQCFFVRDGREVGAWDVDEERDREREEFEGVSGLQGEGDLYVAVGLFGGLEFEVRLRPEDWVFRPE